MRRDLESKARHFDWLAIDVMLCPCLEFIRARHSGIEFRDLCCYRVQPGFCEYNSQLEFLSHLRPENKCCSDSSAPLCL